MHFFLKKKYKQHQNALCDYIQCQINVILQK